MQLSFLATTTDEALDAQNALQRRYGHVEPAEADIVVALGGDGFMLETLHQTRERPIPIYGMNLGTVGFLLNEFDADDLINRIEKATAVDLYMLHMTAELEDGSVQSGQAINEVSIFRQTRQAAKLRIEIDGVCRMPELVCDGVLIATPAGSTAYNLSAHGPIIPLGTEILALTPVSPFRPRRWRGALLPSRSKFTIHIDNTVKRPVSAVADFTEARNVRKVDIWEDRSTAMRLLFDPEHNLEERILKEQFTP